MTEGYKFDEKPHIMLIQAESSGEVGERLFQNAVRLLEKADISYGLHRVPGVLDIPAAVLYAVKSLNFDAVRRRYDGYVGLGAVWGEPEQSGFIVEQVVSGVQKLVLDHTLAASLAVYAAESPEKALSRVGEGEEGGKATDACLRMIELKHHFRLSPKRRWVAR